MEMQPALRRLQNHASLPGHGPEEESFVFALFRANRASEPPSLSSLSEDILRCLATLNEAWNPPSRLRAQSVPPEALRSGAYAVASILSSGLEHCRRWRDEARFSESVLKDLELRLWRIALAWEQVLAGDSLQLHEDVAREEAARFRR
jgi:hypothetical protein